MIAKIISGAQTGADRGALYGAIDANVPVGGWVPYGYKSEDGVIPEDLREHLTPTKSADYVERTVANIRNSDATLVLYFSKYGPGTEKTITVALGNKKTLVLASLTSGKVWLSRDGRPLNLASTVWMLTSVSSLLDGTTVLNVAGPRESIEPGLQAAAHGFVRQLLTAQVVG